MNIVFRTEWPALCKYTAIIQCSMTSDLTPNGSVMREEGSLMDPCRRFGVLHEHHPAHLSGTKLFFCLSHTWLYLHLTVVSHALQLNIFQHSSYICTLFITCTTYTVYTVQTHTIYLSVCLSVCLSILVVINCIHNKCFCLHNICACAVHIYYVL